MVTATGSPIRDKILYDVIRKLTGEVTFEAAVAALPTDFDLDDVEFNGAVSILRMAPMMISENPDGHSLAPSKSLENIEPPRDAKPEPPHIDTAEATPEPVRMTAVQANRVIIDAQTHLGEARIVLQRARDHKMKSQGALATAITAWQNGAPPYTQEMLIRDHLRSEQEKRRVRTEQGVPPQAKTHGNSAVDIAAAYSKDNSPEGAVRSRFQNDGRRRGAFPKSQLGTRNYDPARGPVWKPPV
jgi:hypothetical protein